MKITFTGRKKPLRAEFKRLLQDKGSLGALADYLGTSYGSIAMQKSRGYMATEQARWAEKKSGGEYKAILLAKRWRIK